MDTPKSPTISTQFFERFTGYFKRPVAEQAAKTLSNGAEIEFRIADSSSAVLETFTFTRIGQRNAVQAGSAEDPQIIFTLTPAAANELLDSADQNESEDIGAIGVHILKLIISTDANRRISVRVKVGFLSLFQKGYFGVLSSGGAAFSAFLASKGLGGMGAIKALLNKIKG